MTQYHILGRSFRRPYRIKPYLKMHFRWVAGAAGHTLLVYSYVAVIAVFVSHRVANLALKVAQVLLVLGVAFGISPDLLVAVFTLDHIRILIPASHGLARTVEFLAVAFGTGHTGLSPVDITRYPLIIAEVFIADTGTVAGHAVVLCGGGLAKLVPGNKSPARLIRSANMALTTGGVAFVAVIFKGFGKRGAFLQIPASGFQSSFHPAYRTVKTNLIHMGDILVAGITAYLRWVSYQTRVGYFLSLGNTVTTVTDNTADLPVSALDKLGVLEEDLLPYLQRRQLSCSAFAGGFFRLLLQLR
jgi:hypothetical protein